MDLLTILTVLDVCLQAGKVHFLWGKPVPLGETQPKGRVKFRCGDFFDLKYVGNPVEHEDFEKPLIHGALVLEDFSFGCDF